MREARIGIDIGRVIMAPIVGGRADTGFLSGSDTKAMKTPPSPQAFESVRRLVELLDGRVWLVSKCGSNVQRKTRMWLDTWCFYQETGVRRGAVRFCRRRPDKALHCRELKITHFIDDRVDVLVHLEGLVPHRYLFGEQPKLKRTPRGMHPVLDWPDALAAVLQTLQHHDAPREALADPGVQHRL